MKIYNHISEDPTPKDPIPAIIAIAVIVIVAVWIAVLMNY